MGTPDSKSAAAIAAERPIIEATDRSISPLMMTKVMIRTTIAFSIPNWKRFTWLLMVRKFGTRVTLYARTTRRTTRSSPSQLRRRRMRSRAMGRRPFLGESGLRARLVAPAHPHPHLSQSSQDDCVGGNGDQDEQAEDSVLDELTDARPTQQALLEGLDQQHTEQRADHRARSAEDVDATDHDSGHDLKLETLRGGDRDVAKSHQEHEPSQTRERTADRKRGEDRPLHRESRRASRFRV